MVASRLFLSTFLAAVATPTLGQVVISSVVETFQWRDPWGAEEVPAGFEARCEAKRTFPATQHVVGQLDEKWPRGLQPWAEAIPYFFGGRPYPGSWDGVDHKGPAREIMVMELADVPEAVKDWIEEQHQKEGENSNRYLFGIYEKPMTEGDKIRGTAKLRELDEGGVADKDKVMMFAAGALYDTLPLWVAEGSDCPGKPPQLLEGPTDGMLKSSQKPSRRSTTTSRGPPTTRLSRGRCSGPSPSPRASRP
jgi:hypothetical protein